MLYTRIKTEFDIEKVDYSQGFSELTQQMIIQHAHRYVYAVKPIRGMFRYRERIEDLKLYNEEKDAEALWHKSQAEAEKNFLNAGDLL